MARFARGAVFGFVASDLSGTRQPGSWQPARRNHSQFRGPVIYVSKHGVAPGGIPDVLRYAAGCIRFGAVVRRAEPDVVHVHRPELTLLARYLFPGVPVELFVHEDAANWTPSTTESRWRHQPEIYLGLQRQAVRAADRVVCFSPTAAARLSGLNERIRSMPTWFDPSTFCSTRISDSKLGAVLWVGRLESVKDPLLAIETLRHLPNDFTMTMVGAGRLQATVEARLNETGLSSRVKLLGQVSPSQIADLMRQHRVLLMTSHSEGFPMVLVEMLATGRPVVATHGADPGGLLSHPALGAVADDRNAAVLAELVVQVSATANSAHCRAKVAHLAAPEVIDRILTSDG